MNTIVDLIRQRRDTEYTVFVCGNGGSASTAEHFTNDLFSKGVKAVCLNSNISIMTMIANDFGYEYVFQKQLEVYARPGDLLIVFSCSGTSKNIIKAMKFGIETVPIYGDIGEDCQTAEDKHLALAHRICSEL